MTRWPLFTVNLASSKNIKMDISIMSKRIIIALITKVKEKL
jgi:hypothetical protein